MSPPAWGGWERYDIREAVVVVFGCDCLRRPWGFVRLVVYCCTLLRKVFSVAEMGTGSTVGELVGSPSPFTSK